MNSGLLTCTNADRLTVNCKANRVGLGIFKSDERDNEVADRALGHILIRGHYVLKDFCADLVVVSSLLEGDAVNLLSFDLCRNEIGIDLNDVISTLSLALENLKCLGLISGSDDTVGNLTSDHLCGGNVANVTECNPVTEGAHSVSTSCSCVSASEGRLVKTLDIVNEASLLQLFGERKTNCRTCGADVLKGGNCRKTKSLLKLLNKLPGVESIKEIDVSGSAVENFDGKLASVVHKDLGRLLIGVTTVFKFKFFHFYLPFGICGEEKTF